MVNISTIKKSGLLFIFACLLTVFSGLSGIKYSLVKTAVAQEEAAAQEEVVAEAQEADTASLNAAQKSVLLELKKAANENKNTKQSLMMIGMVVLVVVVAMVLAFKGGSENKSQAFTRTPKKQI